MGLYKRCGCGRTPDKMHPRPPHTVHTRDWFIEYRFPPGPKGKRKREKVGPVKDEARILLAERLQDIRQGRDPALRIIKPRPFEVMVEEFLARHARTRRHYESFVHATNVLGRYFKGRTLQEITPKVIEDFRTARLAE